MKHSFSRDMELVDRYLQAVHFWLPKTQRQDEILAELGEDLRSQIDAKEEELGRPLERGEIKAILKACGNPMAVGSRLGPQRSLIGPALFPIYSFVLKMVLFWILLPVFVFILGPINFANSGGDWAKAVLTTIGELWSGGFIAAGTITLVFAILERTHAVAGIECKWNPDRLPPLQNPERKTSFAQTVSELFFNIFGFVWLLLIPNHPFLILGPAASVFRLAPIWHAFYWPIVLMAAFAILRSAVALVRPQWSWFPPTAQLMQSVLTLILLRFILKAVQANPENAFPFLTLVDSVHDAGKYIAIAAVVNASVAIGLAGAWLGVCIGTVVQTWKFLSRIRKHISATRAPASLQVL